VVSNHVASSSCIGTSYKFHTELPLFQDARKDEESSFLDWSNTNQCPGVPFPREGTKPTDVSLAVLHTRYSTHIWL